MYTEIGDKRSQNCFRRQKLLPYKQHSTTERTVGPVSRGTPCCTVHWINEILWLPPGPDCRVEEWCETNHLSLSALRSADRLRDELIHILRRTELPISMATFGCRSNTLNIKRALLAGFFMQVGELLWLSSSQQRYCWDPAVMLCCSRTSAGRVMHCCVPVAVQETMMTPEIF